MEKTETGPKKDGVSPAATPAAEKAAPQPKGEIGGPQGAEPTRFGDWEVNGRCSDF
jgi:hypothetical protein